MRITKKDIRIRFDEYNTLYFGGVLPPCVYHLMTLKNTPLGRYCCDTKNGKKVYTIWISKRIDWTEEDLRDTIVHEMIHHYIRVVEHSRGGILGHNWRFMRQCKRFREEYGLNITVHGNPNGTSRADNLNLFQKCCRYLLGI